MSSWDRARKPFSLMLSYGVALFVTSLFSVAVHASDGDWKRLTDRQIARLFFPKEKLYFQPTIKGPFMDEAVLDAVVVHELKRLIANFDDDRESEMAVLLRYSDGVCDFCVDKVIVAILDGQKGKLRIPWRTKEHSVFDNGRTTDISTAKLIKKDKFFQVVLKYETRSLGSGNSYKKISIIRWNGKEFAEIWTYDIEKYDHGGQSGNPHSYVAKVDFTNDDKLAKRIRVNSIYATWPHRQEQRTQIEVDEVFAWSEKEQRYVGVRRREYKYAKGELCDSFIDLEQQQKSKENRNCSKIEPSSP